MLVASLLLAAQGQQQIQGPRSRAEFSNWLKGIKSDRDREHKKYNYSGDLYNVPQLKWTQTSYIQPQMHTFDRYFYDPVTKKYTVEKYLDDLNKRYGGIDSMLVWHTYTNIGIDDRNQFELTESMPGHVHGFRTVVQDLHKHGVKVLFPYNPWDTGTHAPSKTDSAALAAMVISMEGDGINGDTMEQMPREFYDASVTAGYPLALEPEIGGGLDSAGWTPLGWGYWEFPSIPDVDHYKWFDSRRLTHVCDRWAKDHNIEIQAAFFNGDGFESWENVWGIWNGLTARNSEEIRRVSSILRFFGRRGFLQSTSWEPHTPVISQSQGVFASKWPVGANTLWTIINHDSKDAVGGHINVSGYPSTLKYYDAYHGSALTVVNGTLNFRIEGHGYGAVYASADAKDDALLVYLARMKVMSEHSLSTYSNTWYPLQQKAVIPNATKIPTTTPAGMVSIPAAQNWKFDLCSMEIEGDELPMAIGFQYPWSSHPARCTSKRMNLTQFYIDQYPITNAQWGAYANATKYTPQDPWNYLRHWANGTIKAGWEKKPVVWVSLDEARGYCKWAGKRLPHVWEWQYAAQGTDGRLYPWGNDECDACRATPHSGRSVPPQDDVDAHPKGASPFGVMDMVGNVWQWTTEFQDEHTRAAAIRGGSNYRPSASMWYLPQAARNGEVQKYMLFDDSFDRAGTIGFRCVADGKPAQFPSTTDFSTPCEDRGVCLDVVYPNVHGEHIDLSVEGTVDWIRFDSKVSRKQGANIITQSVNGDVVASPHGPVLYSWDTATSSSGGLSLSPFASLSLTIPTGKEWKVARLYLGASGSATGVLEIKMGGHVIEHLITAAIGQTFTAVYVVRFSSSVSDGNLEITYSPALGNEDTVQIQAVTLSQ